MGSTTNEKKNYKEKGEVYYKEFLCYLSGDSKSSKFCNNQNSPKGPRNSWPFAVVIPLGGGKNLKKL